MKREEFSAKTKEQAYERSGGLCENKACRKPLQAGRIRYDHIIPTRLGGPPTLVNCQAICKECHDAKTAKEDVPRIAKAKRQHRAHIGATAPKAKIPQRPKATRERLTKLPMPPRRPMFMEVD